jgi:hypothetical protein
MLVLCGIKEMYTYRLRYTSVYVMFRSYRTMLQNAVGHSG